MIISNGWRMPSSAEPRGRTESTARDEQPAEGSSNGLTENDGPSKLQDMKLQDMKKTDQIAGHENAGHENDGPSSMA